MALYSLVHVHVDDKSDFSSDTDTLDTLLNRHGFDSEQHGQIRDDLRAGRVGMAQNRLHPKTHFEDVGGGLAKVDGVLRLVEGFALPREEDEFSLSYYNTATSWIDVDQLLSIFGLSRADISGEDMLLNGSRYAELQEAVRSVAARMPTYITIKETKKRWGRGQEDVFPVLQFERLWGDMSAYLPSQGLGPASFLGVSRQRGQQLKDPAQLDAWSREGTLEWLGKELF